MQQRQSNWKDLGNDEERDHRCTVPGQGKEWVCTFYRFKVYRSQGIMKYFLMILFTSIIFYMILVSYMQLNHPNHFNAF